MGIKQLLLICTFRISNWLVASLDTLTSEQKPETTVNCVRPKGVQHVKVPRGATKQNERLRGYIMKRININSWMGYSGGMKNKILGWGGCGIFAESVCTGEFGPNWVVFC